MTTTARASPTIDQGEVSPQRALHSDIGLMVFSKGLGLLLSLATTVVLARHLGPGGRGVVAVAFSLTLTLVQLGTFGIASANPYFVARDRGSRTDIVANSLSLAAALGVLLVLVGVAIKLLLPGVVAGVDWQDLMIALASIPAVLLGLFLQSVLLGLGRTLAYNLIEVAQSAVTLVAVVVVLVAARGGVTAAMLVLTGGTLAGAVAYAVALRAGWSAFRRPDLRMARTMMRYAFRVYVATLLAFLVIRLDLLLVNYYRGAAQAGIYAVTAALAQGMYVFPQAVGVNLFPRIAQGHRTELTGRVFRLTAMLYGLCCLVTIPLAGPVIHLLYGSRFDEATTLFYWLLPGIFSLGLLTVLSHHFAGRGFPLQAMLVWFAGLAVNLALNFLLLPSHGTWVASLASSIAYAILLVLHVRLFARESGSYAVLLPRREDFSLSLLRSRVPS